MMKRPLATLLLILRCVSVWKTVNNVTSGAFVKMWQERVSQFYSQYSETIAK